ncbi:MAG: hypothetical protein BroJett030_12910 [Alphaproteobacteria bacterium]|nr:MAG: hypothetical protein BroJett030_12910 [Alphaproteobacteria bacterium]
MLAIAGNGRAWISASAPARNGCSDKAAGLPSRGPFATRLAAIRASDPNRKWAPSCTAPPVALTVAQGVSVVNELDHLPGQT